MKVINEYTKKDLTPIKSFKIQKDLNRKIWDDKDKIHSELRDKLLNITDLFIEQIDIKLDVEDIILCGSLANYNYSKYSDFDIHIVTDLSKLSDTEKELTIKYTDLFKKYFKIKYDFVLLGYDIEFYVQDSEEKLNSIGIYSLKNNKWLSKPEVDMDMEIENDKIEEVSKKIMLELDKYSSVIEEGNYNIETVKDGLHNIWSDIKKYRKEGLSSPKGEFSYGNLVFKLLRRNGYIQKYMDISKKLTEDEYTK